MKKMAEFDVSSDVIGRLIFTTWGKEQACASFFFFYQYALRCGRFCVSSALFDCHILKLLNFHLVSSDITIVSQYVTVPKLLFLLLQY